MSKFKHPLPQVAPRRIQREDGTIYTEPTMREVDEELKRRARAIPSARIVSPIQALKAMLHSYPEYREVEVRADETTRAYVLHVDPEIDQDLLTKRAREVLPVDVATRIEVEL